MTAARRAGSLALLVALLALLAPVAAGAAPGDGPRRQDDAPADGATDPFDRLAGCIGATGRLEVVLLVDESASLKETDPEDQRVAAARAALASLDRLRGTGPGGETQIDVLVSAFSYDFTPVGDWTVLDADTIGEVDDTIAGLAERDSSMDTDFYNALDGARQALAERTAEVGQGDGSEVCKAVLLFTDGNFGLGARTTPEAEEEFGTTKSYAPGVVLDSEEAAQEATAAGVTALCEAGGVADQVRSDRITLITVPLTESLGEGPRRLIEAITTGRGEERVCGDPDTDLPGAYLPAADTDELLRTFDLVASRIGGGSVAGEPARPTPCVDDPCDEGAVPFTVDPSFRRVHLFVGVAGEGGRLVLEPPEGDPLTLAPGEDTATDVDGIPVQATWVADQAVTVDLDVPTGGVGAGTWRAVLVADEDPGDATGVVQVVSFSAIVATLDPDSSLTYGEATTLRAEVTAREGDDVDPDIADATVTALITDPITGEETTLDLAPEGDAFAAEYTVPAEVTASALRVALRLDATTSGGAPLTSVSPATDLAVRRPAGYPQLAPARLELTSVTADGTAEGTLVLVGPEEGEGCAWFEDLEVLEAPADAGALTLETQGVGRSDADCTEVAAPLEVPVEVTAADRADGTVSGYLRVQLARGAGDAPITTDVPLTFEMARGVDEAKRLVVAVGLLLGGLLLPLGLLVVINLLTTRFQVLDHVRAAQVPVAVDRTGRITRTDGTRRGLSLVDRDFHGLEDEGGHRRFTWGGLVFTARTPLNPFGEPYAAVAPAEGAADVSREGRRTDLALGLTGSWLFLLDPDATRAAADGGPVGEVHGQLVAFVARGPLAAQTTRLADDVGVRLPTTARRLAGLAGIELVGPATP